MAEAALRRGWTPDEFFAWLDEGHGGDHPWELVDGEPRMMTRPSPQHAIITGNVLRGLFPVLRGGSCRPFAGDFGIETKPNQLRYPDILVDCGPRDREHRIARVPTVVIEVLSPSTRHLDRGVKLEEYRATPSVRHVVLIERDAVDVEVHTRGGTGWTMERITDFAATLSLPAIGVTIPMAEVYEELEMAGS